MCTRAFLLLFVIALLPPSPALACPAFVLKGETCAVIGFNENGRYLSGLVVVNKRGVHKHNLSWTLPVAAQTSKPERTWPWKYGSVTTTVMRIAAHFLRQGRAPSADGGHSPRLQPPH